MPDEPTPPPRRKRTAGPYHRKLRERAEALCEYHGLVLEKAPTPGTSVKGFVARYYPDPANRDRYWTMPVGYNARFGGGGEIYRPVPLSALVEILDSGKRWRVISRLANRCVNPDLPAPGIPRSSRQAIEAGERVPNVHVAIRLARSLGTTVEDLFRAEVGDE